MTIRTTLENREQAKTAALNPAVKNVRFGSYDAEKKRTFWMASVTRFPQGFTLRVARKAVAKKLTAAEAIDALLNAFDKLAVPSDLVRFETWTDEARAAKLDSTATVQNQKPVTPKSKIVTLSREAAAEALGITRNALSKRIKRAGGVYKLESGETVSYGAA